MYQRPPEHHPRAGPFPSARTLTFRSPLPRSLLGEGVRGAGAFLPPAPPHPALTHFYALLIFRAAIRALPWSTTTAAMMAPPITIHS